MAKRATAQPVAEAPQQGRAATANDVYRMPYEAGGRAAVEVADSVLDSILEPDEGQPTEAEPVEAEESAEPTDEAEQPAAEAVEESEEEGEAEPAAEEPTYTVPVNGEEVSVTLSELLAGYSRQADYTRKTQAAAEIRKAAEAEVNAARAERAQYAEKLVRVNALLEQSMPTPPDPALRAEDPSEWAARTLEYDREMQKRQALRQEQEELVARHYAEIQAAETQKLREAVPEWSDAKVYEADKTAMVATAEAYGFTIDHLNAVTDHRLMLMLRDAAKYREIRTNAKPVMKQAAKAPVLQPGGKAVARPSSGSKAEQRAMKERLAQTGRAADAARLIESMLD